MKKIISKTCRVFVKNLSEKPIIYRGVVEEIEEIGTNSFLTILDIKNSKVSINFNDVVQIIQEDNSKY